MNVLVTGGCGLIGYHIAKFYKEEGHDVVVMDNLERSDLLGHKISNDRKYFNQTKLKNLGVHVYPLDISDPFSWKIVGQENYNPDLIFQMAAQCGVPTSIKDPKRDYEVNTIGTLHMLEFARRHDSRVIYASTNKVYPIHDEWRLEGDRWRWDDDELHEDGWPVIPMDDEGSRTPYGNSKFAGDCLCQEYYHIFGVPTGIFRMSCIYGTHQFAFEEQGWAVWFAIAALKGEPIKIYGDGKQVRDMLWVDDVVKAYDCFAKSRQWNHGVWNLGGGPKFTLSINECLDIIEDITGKRSPATFHDWRPSDQRVYTTDTYGLYNRFEWEPTVDPREGLERVIEWVEPILDIF